MWQAWRAFFGIPSPASAKHWALHVVLHYTLTFRSLSKYLKPSPQYAPLSGTKTWHKKKRHHVSTHTVAMGLLECPDPSFPQGPDTQVLRISIYIGF